MRPICFIEGAESMEVHAALSILTRDQAQAPGGGVEPPFQEPKSRVMPLDHPGRWPLSGGNPRDARYGCASHGGRELFRVASVAREAGDRRTAPAHHGAKCPSLA